MKTYCKVMFVLLRLFCLDFFTIPSRAELTHTSRDVAISVVGQMISLHIFTMKDESFLLI